MYIIFYLKTIFKLIYKNYIVFHVVAVVAPSAERSERNKDIYSNNLSREHTVRLSVQPPTVRMDISSAFCSWIKSLSLTYVLISGLLWGTWEIYIPIYYIWKDAALVNLYTSRGFSNTVAIKAIEKRSLVALWRVMPLRRVNNLTWFRLLSL